MSKMKWKAEKGENPLLSNKILWECALDAFSSQSYREASLNDIIKNAGINKGSFYYRFYDKMDLYLSLLSCMGNEKLAFFKEHYTNNQSIDFFDSLKDKVMLSLRFAQQEPRYNGMWRRILVEDPMIRSQVSEEFSDLSQNVLFEEVEKAKEEGLLKSKASSVFIARVILSLFDALDKMITPNSTDDEIVTEVEHMIEMLRNGI